MLGNKIRVLRINFNMTQEELAGKLYVTRNAISKWENNRGIPNIDSLKEMSKLFSVSLDYLISDEEIKELTIRNTETIEETRNLVMSIIIFISLILISIVIPELLLMYDPTGMIAIFLIIMPTIFSFIGIFLIFTKIKWPFLLISSSLALIPIMIYFNHFNKIYSIDLYYLVYYILLNASYLLMSIIIKKDISFEKSRKKSRVFLVILIGLIAIFTIQTLIETAILYFNPSISVAYYTPIVTNFFIYIIPVIISLVSYLKFRITNNRKF